MLIYMAVVTVVPLAFGFSSTCSMLKPCFSISSPSKVVNNTARKLPCLNIDATAVIDDTAAIDRQNLNARRSGNYPPTMWDYDFIQSLTSNFKGENCSKQVSYLKEYVRMQLNKANADNLYKLQLIDSIQRLGVCYHFEDEIKTILEAIYNSTEKWESRDIYAASLRFRLLRQHNYNVPQELFKDFMNESGNFKADLGKDMKGMLYLYEASYFCTKGETIMDKAREFATKHLKDYNKTVDADERLGKLVNHALELPLHWRERRQQARWLIEFYESRPTADDIDPVLLYFAKLDYNIVQAIYQDDVKDMSTWWERLGWGEKLRFARERLMESFYWSVGYNWNPEFKYGRKVLTAATQFITTIDDIYDVYGTVEELELLTDIACRKWGDLKELEQLPDYMKICFTDFYNEIDEIADVAQREYGVSVLPHLKKVWTDIFKAYLMEAKWYHSGYTPSLDEYMSNAWISITGPIILVHSYFLTKNSFTQEALECLMNYPNIVQLSSTILRLADDMGTSRHELERGDNPKVVQCYMKDTGASEEEAREYIKKLISEKWKELNEETIKANESPDFSKPFIEMCLNLARISISMYLYGDGHGAPNSTDKERLSYLFVNPIPL